MTVSSPFEKFDQMARNFESVGLLAAAVRRRKVVTAVTPELCSELANAARARDIGKMRRLLDLVAGKRRVKP